MLVRMVQLAIIAVDKMKCNCNLLVNPPVNRSDCSSEAHRIIVNYMANHPEEEFQLPDFQKIMTLVLAKAYFDKQSAEMNGRYDTTETRILESQVEYFRYGLEGTLPPAWHKYEKQVSQEADPEYQEYLRLQKKFNK
jgi:hypothetical protein